MLRNPLSMLLLVLGMAFWLGMAGSAQAAKLTIHYQIVDGSMNFPFTDPSNPVTGSLAVTIGGTGTTGSFSAATGTATLLSFVAMTTTGTKKFGMAVPQTGSGTASGDLLFSGSGIFDLSAGQLSARFDLLSNTIRGSLFGTSAGSYASFGTISFVGQEISRLLVPEPTIPLLAGCAMIGVLGLLALRRLR